MFKIGFLFILALSLLPLRDACALEVRPEPYMFDYGGGVTDSGGSKFVICRDCSPDTLKLLDSADRRRDIWSEIKFMRDPATRQSDIHPAPANGPAAAGSAPKEDKAFGAKEAPASLTICPATFKAAVVHFGLNSFSIPRKEVARINRIAASLKGKQVSIVGYTCDIGAKKYNKSLSMKRAAAVANLLKKKGISASEVKGNGDCCLVSRIDKPLDRRVDITVRL